MEDAIDCYHRAANLFKIAKKWQQAGQAFCEAANLHAKAQSRHDAATNYCDAANCFKKVMIIRFITNPDKNQYVVTFYDFPMNYSKHQFYLYF